MRVRLVVTGDLEKLSLGASLSRVFQAAGANVHYDAAFKVSGGAMTTNPQLSVVARRAAPQALPGLSRPALRRDLR